MSEENSGRRLLVRGIVQGVGFRPFVYSLAERLDLKGWVRNSSRGLEIEVNGPAAEIAEFELAIRQNPPPLSHIDTIESEIIPGNGYSSFQILDSEPQPGEFLPVSPDVAICPDCQQELFDPANRRYRYPFINCTNCGPRFTIIKEIPYDRPNTTMAGFSLCPDCAAEYADPADRRFHAQPTACAVCGPQIWLEENGKTTTHREDAIRSSRLILKNGGILAIKGLGGFHLACDAFNSLAVAELRRRKQRSEKPFALMAFSLDQVEPYCLVQPEERELLLDRSRPVVLLARKHAAMPASELAPGQKTLGVMLAYTPLHLLLMEPEPGFPEMLVMTSGNLSEEPIAYLDTDARSRLSGLADAFLMHDRPIHTRLDDSVTRLAGGAPMLIRRSRGYAPHPIRLAQDQPPTLGGGAELKNTFCLTRDRYAFVSHHIGDMENYETLQAFETGLEHYQRLFKIDPVLLACDMHPDYLASRYLREHAQENKLPLIEVQHHHAHMAACLAENGWTDEEDVIGLSFDGTGYGVDGAVWGSEVLLGGYAHFERLYHLKYLPLPGGDAAARHPARMALAALWALGMDWDPELAPVRDICEADRTVLKIQLERSINTPLTSSMGRLFDVAASLAGVRQIVNYEGQAAMEFEALVDPAETEAYAFPVESGLIDPAPALESIMSDWLRGETQPVISARFHNGLVQLCLQVCSEIRNLHGVKTVALSGGVWQNKTLLEGTLRGLKNAGFNVLIHHQLPPNDGCISLGQALVAAHQIKL